MKQNTLGGLVVILFVCTIAFVSAAVFGMAHVGEDFSKEILPTSLTRSSDILQVIDEKSFEPSNITVKYQTKTTVKSVDKNTTNYTKTNNSSDSKKNDTTKKSTNRTSKKKANSNSS
ncbi:MAG: hypothetical protein BZ138_04955 [Methanosphaera sp. rholeuAM270]|nr:MAG: hypothetical protein BZ138_04955 [Methanosphaera sp. rholeuAM270]